MQIRIDDLILFLEIAKEQCGNAKVYVGDINDVRILENVMDTLLTSGERVVLLTDCKENTISLN